MSVLLHDTQIQLDYTSTKIEIYMCCVYLKIWIWYNTIPKHAKCHAQTLRVESKTTPWRTDLNPLALQRRKNRPRRKNKNREDQRFGDPPMNKSKHLWIILTGSRNTNVKPGYTKLICNQLKSNLIWTYMSWSIFEEDFLRALFKYVSIPTTAHKGESKDVLIIDSLGSCNVTSYQPREVRYDYI